MPLVSYAQVDVVRYAANEYGEQGIVYYLPKSQINIVLYLEKSTYTPGELSAYAPILLGKEVATQGGESYRLATAEIRSIGIPDEERQYVVSFKATNPFSYVTLTKGGVLAGINSNGIEEIVSTKHSSTTPPTNKKADLALPREYALATSKAKKAEIAAGMLFELRGNLVELLSGKAENAPRDGAAYELAVSELKGQITALETLFFGETLVTTSEQTFTLAPEDEINNRIVARFSKKEGLLPANDKRGDAITFDLKAVQRSPFLTTEEVEKQERKLKGIIYNLPGSAQASLRIAAKEIVNSNVAITQFGSRISLANQILRPKEGYVVVAFDPHTGALRSINNNKE